MSASAARNCSDRGIGQLISPIGGGEDGAECRHLVEQERVVEREEHLHLLERRLRMDAGAVGRGLVDELEPTLPTVAEHRQTLQRVDVHRLSRCRAHRKHQRTVGAVMTLEVRTADELDHAVCHLGEHARQRDQLVV